jgi:hypothetical protein
MLIKLEQLRGIRDGSVTCAFRRWRRPTVRAGGTLRTAVGVLAIAAVEPVRRGDLTTSDARAAGHDSLSALLAELRGRPGTLYRIDLRFRGADPRRALRARSRMPRAALDEVLIRLARLDARSRRGPWTREVLELLRDRPGVRAGDLASEQGRATQGFKRDVRKLKELGLTESPQVGCRLAPRGAAVLRAFRSRRP